MTVATKETFKLVYQVEGTGDPILFISGTNDDKNAWAENVPAFEGYQRITFDNRDVGESPRATEPYTVADMAADAKNLLDELGLVRVHVVGHSMGGTIAQELALLAPERVRSLVLVATFARVDHYLAELIEDWKQTRRALSSRDFARNATFFWCGGSIIEDLGMDQILELMEPVVAAQETEAFARQLDAVTARDRRPMLGSIGVPTLVIWGDEDTTVRRGIAKELADGIPGARFQVIERSGHSPLFEQVEQFNAMVLEFLKSVD